MRCSSINLQTTFDNIIRSLKEVFVYIVIHCDQIVADGWHVKQYSTGHWIDWVTGQTGSLDRLGHWLTRQTGWVTGQMGLLDRLGHWTNGVTGQTGSLGRRGGSMDRRGHWTDWVTGQTGWVTGQTGSLDRQGYWTDGVTGQTGSLDRPIAHQGEGLNVCDSNNDTYFTPKMAARMRFVITIYFNK